MSNQNQSGEDQAVEETLALCGGPFCFPCEFKLFGLSVLRTLTVDPSGILIYQGWMKIRNGKLRGWTVH